MMRTNTFYLNKRLNIIMCQLPIKHISMHACIIGKRGFLHTESNLHTTPSSRHWFWREMAACWC
jgi:hypothetical protein